MKQKERKTQKRCDKKQQNQNHNTIPGMYSIYLIIQREAAEKVLQSSLLFNRGQ